MIKVLYDKEIICARCKEPLEGVQIGGDKFEYEPCECVLKKVDESIYDEGYDDGYEEGYNNGHDEGYEEGFDEGHEDGHSDGYEKGLLDSK